MENPGKIEKTVNINAGLTTVWDVLTNPSFARKLGNEIDKNSFLESEWKLGSKVYFKYEPDKVVATGTITEINLHSYILVEYKEINYSDAYSLTDKDGIVVLTINSGPYPIDYEAQLEVWDKWLLKVKELSEEIHKSI